MTKDLDFFFLLYLAKKGNLTKTINSTTLEIASDIGVSQQSVSRKLRELESQKLISRKASPAGVEIFISIEGKNLLKNYLTELENLFNSKTSSQKLSGRVEAGFGEGEYYLSFNEYKKQFKEKLGLEVFSGTLNLKVNEIEVENFLLGKEPILIPGFKRKERTFGGLDCFRVKVNNSVQGALIFPHRSNHPKDTVEIIAEISLRKKFKLKDNSKVELNLA